MHQIWHIREFSYKILTRKLSKKNSSFKFDAFLKRNDSYIFPSKRRAQKGEVLIIFDSAQFSGKHFMKIKNTIFIILVY